MPTNDKQAERRSKKAEKSRQYWANRRQKIKAAKTERTAQRPGHAQLPGQEKKPLPAPTKPVISKPAPVQTAPIPARIVSLNHGFAFARPEDGGDDYFIRSEGLRSAFVGDHVLLYNVRLGGRGPSAQVQDITEKASRLITGTLARTRTLCEFIPDASIRFHVEVEKGFAMGARDGDKIQAEIHRLPHSDMFLARVTKIYGRAESAKICADAIVDQHQIKTKFPREVLAEANAAASRSITEADLKGRLDLRDTAICTIDGADAKDLDDAVSVTRTKTGFKLGVHIADVSHYIRENGPLDQEAMERGTSVYFADRVIPMLPEDLSNGACSLNAGMDKLTFSAIMRLDKQGNFESYEFRKTVINSKVRGVYSEVNAIFAGTADKTLKQKYAPVARSLSAAKELADILKAKSRRNGTVDLESSESAFTLDENGVCVDVRPRESGAAEQMIEQLMVAANQAAAKLAKEKQIPFVYRVHEEPSPDRVDTLAELVGALGLNAKPIVHSGKVSAQDLAAIMEQAAGTPAQKVVSHQLLRTMAKARYDSRPLGHFGLALEDYCHFTSPIRRYPDTSIHRILTALLEGKSQEALNKRYLAFASDSAAQSSKREVNAMQAERAAEDCYMAEYMAQHIGESYVGVISGVTMRGVFVELPNSAEGFVSMDTFPGAHFQFDGKVTQYDAGTGKKLTIGQTLPIKVVAADVATRRIDFIPAEIAR